MRQQERKRRETYEGEKRGRRKAENGGRGRDTGGRRQVTEERRRRGRTEEEEYRIKITRTEKGEEKKTGKMETIRDGR